MHVNQSYGRAGADSGALQLIDGPALINSTLHAADDQAQRLCTVAVRHLALRAALCLAVCAELSASQIVTQPDPEATPAPQITSTPQARQRGAQKVGRWVRSKLSRFARTVLRAVPRSGR